MAILVFLSHKDANSMKLFEEIQKVNRFEKMFNTVDIHAEKHYIKEYNIKKIPSLVFQDRIYVGQNAMTLIKQFQSQFPQENSKKEQTEKQPIQEPVGSTGFSPADSIEIGNPLFAPPIQIRPVQDDETDLQTKMDRYNESRASIMEQS
jgi:hypothetical protein